MKYNERTAVHVTDEFTRQNLIEFFEAIKAGCNKYSYNINSIDIGEVWFIADDGRLVCNKSIKHKINNHTIISGIPKNWREEMEATVKDETVTNSTFTDPLLNHEAVQLEQIRNLQSRVNELEECLRNIVRYTR